METFATAVLCVLVLDWYVWGMLSCSLQPRSYSFSAAFPSRPSQSLGQRSGSSRWIRPRVSKPEYAGIPERIWSEPCIPSSIALRLLSHSPPPAAYTFATATKPSIFQSIHHDIRCLLHEIIVQEVPACVSEDFFVCVVVSRSAYVCGLITKLQPPS